MENKSFVHQKPLTTVIKCAAPEILLPRIPLEKNWVNIHMLLSWKMVLLN